MNNITEYLPFLIPIALIELALAVAALVHVLSHNNYRFGNRAIWIVVSLCIGIIGPIVYFTVGKGDD
jgi:hypothetical protein